MAIPYKPGATVIAFGHTVFAIVVGFSAIFLLEASLALEPPSLIAQWRRYVATLWQALADLRYRHLTIAPMIYVALLPFLTALAMSRSAERNNLWSACRCLIIAGLSAAAGLILYFGILRGLIYFTPYRVTVMARLVIFWHWFLIVLWTTLTVPLLLVTNALLKPRREHRS
ncbi:hypothetical protein RPMA_02265 [Tardiphaga alba]|uniref:Uncharacterized protein n=1 Tax=Tardiphaga alba TaxID=340268 RepID=A0ABX8A5R8_9BRAD|nr:hypothetical protein [Tardiphaga alba]QUS37818.1 hypothetical protein RPMA_02265 [Tardiphaga alba]